MNTIPTPVSGMIGVSRQTAEQAGGILGYVTWFSVPDEPVSLQAAKREWSTQGLNPSLLPKDTRSLDVFKRACRSLNGRHTEDGHIRDNDVRPVLENTEACIYQITTTVRDLDERVIEYQKAVRSIFFKRDGTIKHNMLHDAPRRQVVWLMDHIDDYIADNGRKIEGAAIRKVVRSYLSAQSDEERGIEGLAGENLRGRAGGIYFVKAEHAVELESVASFLDQLYHGRAFLYMLPMADGDYEREIIRHCHVANTRNEMLEAIAKLKRMQGNADRKRSVRSTSVSHWWAVYHQLRRKVADYKDILGENIEEIDDMADAMRRQLEKLD